MLKIFLNINTEWWPQSLFIDIYKLINKCHVEQDVGIPIDNPNLAGPQGLLYFKKSPSLLGQLSSHSTAEDELGTTNLIF